MPSRLVYEANDEIPMKYIMRSPRIVVPVDMMERKALKEGITQLEEEERLGPDE